MKAETVRRIEKNIQRAASASFGIAVGFAAYNWLSLFVAQPQLGAETGGAAAIAYLFASRLLNAVRPSARQMPVPVFDVRTIELAEPQELILGEDDVYRPAVQAAETLELDDILAEIGPDSRIVRLFDPAAMPTPGQLKSRIDRHLDGAAAQSQSAEAAQALHDALAQLRQSVR
jgi:hypothetical protein